MPIFLKVLKELGIALLFLLLILGVIAFVFYVKVPLGKVIPESVEYTKIDQSQFAVSGEGIEDKKAATQTFETSASQLEEYLTEKIVNPGRFEPFSPVTSEPDIPSERVGSVVTGEEGEISAKTGSTANTTGESALE